MEKNNQKEVGAGMQVASDLLNADELAALRRFDECAQDGEGYDVPKEMMQRLAAIGVVQRRSGAYYQATDFGQRVLASPAQASAAPADQASQGAGRIDEILKGIDEQEVQSEHGWWETSIGAAFGAQKLAEVKVWAARCAGDAVADDLRDAVEAFLDVLDGYGEQLVPINRKSATVFRLREAFTVATQKPAAQPVEQPADDARDAARYRWLRNHALNTYGICPVVVMVGEDCKPVPDDIDSSGLRYEENLDAAIDAAMQASKGATDSASGDAA